MRWLCLHGRGTSAQIFELQTAKLRESLGSDHEFIFINGTVSTEPDAGAAEIADEFFGWVEDPTDVTDAEQYEDLLEGLADVVDSQGPFDGLMGFSEGGTTAAMMLACASKTLFSGESDARGGKSWGRFVSSFDGIRCAAFFSAQAPIVKIVSEGSGQLRRLDPGKDGVVINIPTLHCWSSVRPADEKAAHAALSELCEEGKRQIVLHQLGHDVPGSKPGSDLQETVRAIERLAELTRI